MIGKTVSHYNIIEKLGEGGMGVVYKAQDTKLDRFVALKFLPLHLAASEQDKARFVQEAKSASALNHPNVCTIHDIQEHDGTMFIVMEYVEGQTLRDRKGTISYKQAIEIGIQIADGLSAAHEKGIIHRDIKPDNIMLRKDGIAQIMDFGLAKLQGVSRLTKEGSTVGTAGYMSPEQVQGLEADHRSDIFSYGVLLYELLTGELPFKGIHETALAYEIVNVDSAPMSSIKSEIDPALDAVVLECLEKDINERAQSIKQVAVDLKRYKRESSRSRVSRITAARPIPNRSSIQASAGIDSNEISPPITFARSRKPAWILSFIFFLIASGSIAFHFLVRPVPEPKRVFRSSILPPAKVNFNMLVGGHIAISPDGRLIVFVGIDSTGTNMLWVRSVSSLTASPLVGTNGATYPFWSPDGKVIGYFADSKLKKIDASGGPTLTICDATEGRGGTWNEAGIIVFAPNASGGLFKVSSAGGEPQKATTLDSIRNIRNHRFPHFLPGGKYFLYNTQANQGGTSENDVIKIASVDGSVDSVLMHGNSNVEYASGFLLFHRQATLMAQQFDTVKYQLIGDAVPIAEQLQYNDARSKAIYSVSKNGLLIFQGGEEQQGKLAFLDHAGNRTKTFMITYPRAGKLSRSGKKITYVYLDNQSRQSDIWLHEIEGGRSSRFSFNMANENNPFWSPSEDSIIFSSNRSGKFDLYMKSSIGTGEESLLVKTDLDKYVTDWSIDGRYITYSVFGSAKTKVDLWILPMFGDRKPILFLQTEFREGNATFSPDGKWIVYQSDESGRFEVYARSLDGSAGKWQVSINGGGNPRWTRDGRHVYFQSLDRKAMLADIKMEKASIIVESVKILFDYESRGIIGNIQDISTDGQEFLFLVTENRMVSPPITLVVNWDEELKKK